MESEEGVTTIPQSPARNSPHPIAAYAPPTPMEPKVESQEAQYDEELLLKWDDHHKSFFELAEDLCHQVKYISSMADHQALRLIQLSWTQYPGYQLCST